MKAKVIKTGEVVDVYHEPQHGQITNIYKESVLVNGRMWTENELDFSVKANEAPERIWMNDDWVHQFDEKCFMGEDSVEYTRTDAFIKKTCEYFRAKKKCVFACIGEDVYHSLLNEEEIEDFRNFMKGE